MAEDPSRSRLAEVAHLCRADHFPDRPPYKTRPHLERLLASFLPS